MATATVDKEQSSSDNEKENDRVPPKSKSRSHHLSKSLYNAISDGNLVKVKEIMPNINHRQINRCVKTKNSGHNVTPLLWAIYNHQEEIAKVLMEHGADVNKQGTYEENGIIFNYSPLLRAVENEHERMVSLLVQNGANVHLKAPGPRYLEEEGGSLSYVKWMYPMNLALHIGNFEIIKILMETYNVTTIYDTGKHTCLCRAAMMLDTTIIQYMIMKGAKMCRGEGSRHDVYSTPGVCQFLKNLIQNSFRIQFMSDTGNIYFCEQNNFRCLMSICLTDYARIGSVIHRAALSYMCFASATQSPSLDQSGSNYTQNDGSFDWLHRLTFVPSKLKHICRIVIREAMHTNLPDLELLPLPKQLLQYLSFNPFLYNPLFSRPCEFILKKTLWEKKKLLVTSNFFFSHNIF